MVKDVYPSVIIRHPQVVDEVIGPDNFYSGDAAEVPRREVLF